MTQIHGLELFCNWKDIRELPDRTMRILDRCGATRAIVMAQPALNSDVNTKHVRTFADRCADAGIALSLCTGPAIIEYASALMLRDRLVALCRELHATPMLDAEPVRVGKPNQQRWSPERVAPWLTVPDMQITTTRMEAPRIGAHGRITYAQLEGQASTSTLSHALGIFSKYAPLERVVPVLGSFDTDGDKRTVAEVKLDLERCTDQARLCGRLAMFVAQTTSDAEADVMREWACETWA
jgi:hypothetical protein